MRHTLVQKPCRLFELPRTCWYIKGWKKEQSYFIVVLPRGQNQWPWYCDMSRAPPRLQTSASQTPKTNKGMRKPPVLFSWFLPHERMYAVAKREGEIFSSTSIYTSGFPCLNTRMQAVAIFLWYVKSPTLTPKPLAPPISYMGKKIIPLSTLPLHVKLSPRLVIEAIKKNKVEMKWKKKQQRWRSS